MKALDYTSLFLAGVVIISCHCTSDSSVLILEFELTGNTSLLGDVSSEGCIFTHLQKNLLVPLKAWRHIQTAQIPFRLYLYLTVGRSSLRHVD